MNEITEKVIFDLQDDMKSESDPVAKACGNYLLEKFKTDDELAKAYKERNITLATLKDYIYECARKKLNNQSGAIEDKEIYGWVIHYVQDEKIEIKPLPKAKPKTVAHVEDSEEEEPKKVTKPKKVAKPKKPKADKPKKIKKEEMYMNLFEDFGNE